MNCIYIKFTSSTIHNIDKWDSILTNSCLYDNFVIYIWIYYYNTDNDAFITEIKTKYSKCIFISNLNISNFLPDAHLSEINTIVSHLAYHNDVGRSHMICYYIGKKYNYLINLDGDDMFYPKFDINLLHKAICYMENHNLKFITRPYWICYNNAYKSSFGFTISSSDILDYLQVHDNLHLAHNGNLDQFLVIY